MNHTGRAILQDNADSLQITIKAKRNWLVIIFLIAWISGWLIGELAVIASLLGLIGNRPGGLLLFLWLIGWTTGGYFALQTLLWNIGGKEIITVGQAVLTIDRRGALFQKIKVYDLSRVKNLRVKKKEYNYGPFLEGRHNRYGSLGGGMIYFDYGLEKIKFAGELKEAEAQFIINELKNRRLLTEKNYV